ELAVTNTRELCCASMVSLSAPGPRIVTEAAPGVASEVSAPCVKTIVPVTPASKSMVFSNSVAWASAYRKEPASLRSSLRLVTVRVAGARRSSRISTSRRHRRATGLRCVQNQLSMRSLLRVSQESRSVDEFAGVPVGERVVSRGGVGEEPVQLEQGRD